LSSLTGRTWLLGLVKVGNCFGTTHGFNYLATELENELEEPKIKL